MGAGVLSWISKTGVIKDQLQLVLTGRTKERNKRHPEGQRCGLRGGEECSSAPHQPEGELAVKRGPGAALIHVLERQPPTYLLDTQRWHMFTQREGPHLNSCPLPLLPFSPFIYFSSIQSSAGTYGCPRLVPDPLSGSSWAGPGLQGAESYFSQSFVIKKWTDSMRS